MWGSILVYVAALQAAVAATSNAAKWLGSFGLRCENRLADSIVCRARPGLRWRPGMVFVGGDVRRRGDSRVEVSKETNIMRKFMFLFRGGGITVQPPPPPAEIGAHWRSGPNGSEGS